MKATELLSELRYSKPRMVSKYHEPDGTFIPGGRKEMGMNYSKPSFRGRGTKGHGAIMGTVGDWLTQMGATPHDLPAAYQDVKQSAEYHDLLDAGIEDVSSSGDVKNGTFAFKGRAAAGLVDPNGVHDALFHRKVLANGQIRAYAPYTSRDGELKSNTGHGWRPTTLHPFTQENDPHSTPHERIVKTMRQSLARLMQQYEHSTKVIFKHALKHAER